MLEATEEVRIPRWFRKGERHIYIHQDGLTCGSKEAYKSHRRIRARYDSSAAIEFLV